MRQVTLPINREQDPSQQIKIVGATLAVALV